MLDQATGRVFFAADIQDHLILEGDKADLFIQLDPGNGPAVVRVTWVFDEPYSPAGDVRATRRRW